MPETMEENLPFTEPLVTQKLDGSLGIHYWYDHHEGIATRGSFTSPQAQWASAWYEAKKAAFKGLDKYDRIEWPYGTTALFEIIYAQNRIVVDYDFEGLVLIGLVDNEMGYEWDLRRMKEVAEYNEIPLVKTYHDLPLSQLKDMNVENEEGYVLTYFKRDEPPLKVKIKMADYVRLHRVVTGMNPRGIWELLKSGAGFDRRFDGAPPHFRAWFDRWVESLRLRYAQILLDAGDIYDKRPGRAAKGEPDREYRKRCALFMARQNRPDLSGIFFKMLDRKDVEEAVWNLIEPSANDKSFRAEGE